MNKKILISVSVIALAAAIVVGGTVAFFSDTETSTGNTFTAGAIDLKIDNKSYRSDESGNMVLSSETSWDLRNLGNEIFFNFTDLKPGDMGEDTISIHIDNNDAWMCMSTRITATPENGITEPEAADDTTTGSDQGELQDAINFAFWVDDGDNVLERDEFDKGVWEGTAQEFMNTSPRIIADSTFNIFGQVVGTPVKGDSIFHIAKAWCFGKLTLNPVATGSGQNPTVATGITCDGSQLDNSTQTDGIEGDISFFAVQSRNNDSFTCSSYTPNWSL